MTAVWCVIEDAGDIAALQGVFGSFPAGAQALVLGDAALVGTSARVFDGVTWIDTAEASGEAYAKSAADLLVSYGPAVVAGVARPASRMVAARCARALDAAYASNVVQVVFDGDALRVTRSVYDDYVEEDRIEGAAVLMVNPISVAGDAPALRETACEAARVEAALSAAAERIGVSAIAVSAEESAERVVGAGFGARSPEAFAAVQALAGALDAELGASMNMVENTTLMPGKRYIGLSGMIIAPKLYVACGISGAYQHLVGVRNAGCTVVINKDPKAKFFDHADYGIVGSLEEVAPALVRALG